MDLKPQFQNTVRDRTLAGIWTPVTEFALFIKYHYMNFFEKDFHTSLKFNFSYTFHHAKRFPSLYGDYFDLSSIQTHNESTYSPIIAYNQSKLCNLMFALELNRRWSPLGVHCNAVNPGAMIYTRLQRYSPWYKALFTLVRPFTKSKVKFCFLILSWFKVLITLLRLLVSSNIFKYKFKYRNDLKKLNKLLQEAKKKKSWEILFTLNWFFIVLFYNLFIFIKNILRRKEHQRPSIAQHHVNLKGQVVSISIIVVVVNHPT